MKRIFALCCAMILLLTSFALADGDWKCPQCGGRVSAFLGDVCPNCGFDKSKAANLLRNLSVGDSFTFGSYEQDNDTLSGKEPIEWIVLDVQGDEALVIARYGLDAKLYNEKQVDVTWETCTLRKWLNEEFYNAAFTAEEQLAIVRKTNSNPDNVNFDTKGGNSTIDSVFLLSIDEAKQYFKSYEERKAIPTKYAVAQGAYESDAGNCWWWLRSPGNSQSHAAGVLANGFVLDLGGFGVSGDHGAVRPALVLRIS